MLRWARSGKTNKNAAAEYKLADEKKRAEARKRYVEAEQALGVYGVPPQPYNTLLK